MLFITLITVIFALILGVVIQEFVPKKVISDTKNVSFSRVFYHGAEISVDESKLIKILDKYNSKRTVQEFFPYETAKIDIEIDFVDKQRPKHILLGEFNIWYEPDKGTYKILNSQQLKGELKSILEE